MNLQNKIAYRYLESQSEDLAFEYLLNHQITKLGATQHEAGVKDILKKIKDQAKKVVGPLAQAGPIAKDAFSTMIKKVVKGNFSPQKEMATHSKTVQDAGMKAGVPDLLPRLKQASKSPQKTLQLIVAASKQDEARFRKLLGIPPVQKKQAGLVFVTDPLTYLILKNPLVAFGIVCLLVALGTIYLSYGMLKEDPELSQLGFLVKFPLVVLGAIILSPALTISLIGWFIHKFFKQLTSPY